MDAVDIVEVDVLAEHAMKMPLVEHDHMIEQLPAHASHSALGRPILPWASIGGAHGREPELDEGSRDLFGEDGVVVEDEVARFRIVWERLSKLLNDPLCSGVRCDAEVQDLSSAMANRKPDVQQAESKGRDDEEVHRGDDVAMIPEEGHPALVLSGIGAPFG